MEKSITFRNLVKLIHPDVSNVENPSEKMTIAVKFKSSPTFLYKKAVEWGVIIPEENKPKVTPKYKWFVSWSWNLFHDEIPRTGDMIFVTTLGYKVRVVKTTPKRFYFYTNGKKTFCNRNNGILTRKVRRTRKAKWNENK